jgi:CheY-like chemotaxis protein
MWLESAEGQGSTFFISAPIPPGQAPAGGEQPAIAPCGQSPAEQSLRRALSILVAEDNAVNQRLIRTLLEKRGHRVTVVGTGAAALAAWRQDGFDCILMDIQMPEMDGYEATRLIRARESGNGAHIPIIALTAHAMKGDREKCQQAGMSRLSWKWKGRSTVKIAERAREETTKALQRRREGRHFEAALAGTGAGFQAL